MCVYRSLVIFVKRTYTFKIRRNTRTHTQQLTCSNLLECVRVFFNFRWDEHTKTYDHFSTSPTVPKLLESLSRTLYTFVILVTARKSKPVLLFFRLEYKLQFVSLSLFLFRRSMMVGGLLLGLSSFTRTITLHVNISFYIWKWSIWRKGTNKTSFAKLFCCRSRGSSDHPIRLGNIHFW